GKLPDHEGAADVVFSPTGRTLASVGFDGTIVLSDLADPLHPLRLGEPLTADAAEPLTPAFAAAGSLMAAAGANDVLVLWDLADPAHPRRVGEASAGTGRLVGTGTSAALSPDGGVLAAAFGESVLLWDLADPHAPRLLDTPLAASASFLAFDPVGRV